MTLSIENDLIKASFNAKGAELTSLKHKNTSIEYLWQGDPEFWGRQAPVLFPIVGKLKNDTYQIANTEYHLTQHGFARDMNFRVLSQTSTSIVFSLVSNQQTRVVYPYEFELQIHYTLDQTTLTTSYVVYNRGQEPLLYAIGGHPAFNVPIDSKGTFSDYTITANAIKRTQLPLNDGIDLANQKEVGANLSLNLTRELFKGDALVYHSKGMNSFKLHSLVTPHAVEVHYDELPFVGIWSPYPKEAPFVCIEPWLGVADTKEASGLLNEKYAITKLAVNTKKVSSYHITVT